MEEERGLREVSLHTVSVAEEEEEEPTCERTIREFSGHFISIIKPLFGYDFRGRTIVTSIRGDGTTIFTKRPREHSKVEYSRAGGLNVEMEDNFIIKGFFTLPFL